MSRWCEGLLTLAKPSIILSQVTLLHFCTQIGEVARPSWPLAAYSDITTNKKIRAHLKARGSLNTQTNRQHGQKEKGCRCTSSCSSSCSLSLTSTHSSSCRNSEGLKRSVLTPHLEFRSDHHLSAIRTPSLPIHAIQKGEKRIRPRKTQRRANLGQRADLGQNAQGKS